MCCHTISRFTLQTGSNAEIEKKSESGGFALHAPAFPLFAQHCQRESGCRCTNKLCYMLQIQIQICNTNNTKIRIGDDDINEMINKLIYINRRKREKLD